MNNYDFIGKSIKCDTWEQMLHLAKLAEEQGYKRNHFRHSDFLENCRLFEAYIVLGELQYTNFVKPYWGYSKIIDYSEFTNTLPTETIEVAGCDGCPMYKGDSEGFSTCRHPKQDNSGLCQFDTCPLKPNQSQSNSKPMTQQEIKENLPQLPYWYHKDNLTHINCVMDDNGFLVLSHNTDFTAHAITHAINNTYGKGINPESVPDMFNTLQLIELNLMGAIDETVTAKLIRDILNKAAL